jgi:hypothetical protein
MQFEVRRSLIWIVPSEPPVWLLPPDPPTWQVTSPTTPTQLPLPVLPSWIVPVESFAPFELPPPWPGPA